jgi:hypothetical protein
MKFFIECMKNATANSVHMTTALGNENYRFGRGRSQPKRQNRRATIAEGKRKEDDDKVTAALSKPIMDNTLDNVEEEEMAGDIVRASKWMLPLDIKKADPDQHLIFGWASVVEKNGKAIIDKQGDVIPVSELENAAYEFTLNSRTHGDMHRTHGGAKLVESMVFSKDKQKALGIDLGQVGWWVGFKVHDEELWAAHKRGDRPEFSIGGAAVPVDVDESFIR